VASGAGDPRRRHSIRYPDAHYAAQKTCGKSVTGTEAFMIQSGIAVTSPNRRRSQKLRWKERNSKTDKKELLNEFEKRLNAALPIQYPSNIELVRKYYDEIHPIQRDKQK